MDAWTPSLYERKRHSPENRAFSAPLVRCSIAAVLLVCAVLPFCSIICAQETLSNELWPSLGNILGTGDIEQRTVTQSWQYLCTEDIEQRTVAQSQKYIN